MCIRDSTWAGTITSSERTNFSPIRTIALPHLAQIRSCSGSSQTTFLCSRPSVSSSLVRLDVYKRQVQECARSGKSKREWCAENGIGYSTFMRWQKRLREELAGAVLASQEIVPVEVEVPERFSRWNTGSAAAKLSLIHILCYRVRMQSG